MLQVSKMYFSQKHTETPEHMELLIAQAKKQFDGILSYVQGEAQHKYLNEVEKGIFLYLLKLGRTLLMIFLQQKGVGRKGKMHADNKGNKRPYHSIKQREYLSIFGRISIQRACYWKKGLSEIYPLDAELNLPKTKYSYVLQEWGSSLGGESAYEKAAKFLESILGIPLWGSTVETIMKESCFDVPNFYKERQALPTSSEKELLVATGDGKGIVMRKDQIEKKPSKKPLPRIRKIGEKERKKTIEDTVKGKEEAFKRLQKEVEKRDYNKEKIGVALVDGEHKLRDLFKKYLPWFLIIIDIYHVMEYLWRGARVFYKEGSEEAEKWASEKLERLLNGRVEEVICELKKQLRGLSKNKREELKKVVTYLENGKNHMRYDQYLAKGYPIGSGVVEGACKNLVKDRMEQCGMRWTIVGAEAVLEMRSIQINGMTTAYWNYHIAQERERLYGIVIENELTKLAA
jgi:hypothetical protein